MIALKLLRYSLLFLIIIDVTGFLTCLFSLSRSTACFSLRITSSLKLDELAAKWTSFRNDFSCETSAYNLSGLKYITELRKTKDALPFE